MFKRYHLRFDSNQKLTVRVRLWALFTDHIIILLTLFLALLFSDAAIKQLMRGPFHEGGVIVAVISLFFWGVCYMFVISIRPQKFWREHTFSRINYQINGQLVANREDINAIHILERHTSSSETDSYTYTLSIKHHHNQKQIIDVSSHDKLSLLELADTIADLLDLKIVYQKS